MVSNAEFASGHSLSSNGKEIRVSISVLVYVAHAAKIKISVKCALLIYSLAYPWTSEIKGVVEMVLI